MVDKKLFVVRVANHLEDEPESYYVEATDIEKAIDRAEIAHGDRKSSEELPGTPKKNLVVLSAKQIDGRILR